MRWLNDLLRVEDKDGKEHHVNLANVVDIVFDTKDGAVIITTTKQSSESAYRLTIKDAAETNRLRAALLRREDAVERALAAADGGPAPESWWPDGALAAPSGIDKKV